MEIGFVTVRDFDPTSDDWTPVGNVSAVEHAGTVFLLGLEGGGRSLQVSFLSATCFRVRFNPALDAGYGEEKSPAVVNRDFGAFALEVVESTSDRLVIDTQQMRVRIDLRPYRVRVYRGDQLVCADEETCNLVYMLGGKAVANIKMRPVDALYCGFGEKAGERLFKNASIMTQFNYDNYKYTRQIVPGATAVGPLDPTVALYASIPFMIEVNPQRGYVYGLFFDNQSQSYFNMGRNDWSDMEGKYYFGALFGELDYYFFLGERTVDVLRQYTHLTGRAPMPPRYTLGYHQGCYGYFDRGRLETVANAYRAARFPCDGLHIDIDLQDNYRTFTHSKLKFPNIAEMMEGLHAQGFKCSTDISPLVTDNVLDEKAEMTPYRHRQALLAMGGLIYDAHAGGAVNADLFKGQVNYGDNAGVNPYPYPPLRPNQNGMTPLTTSGNYPDLGRADVREAWGWQYKHLIKDVGLDMIWQDMMCPALDGNVFENGTFPLTLMVSDGDDYVPNALTHNAYAQYLAMATWEGLNRLRPDIRNFLVVRSGYAGIQRYAALWTGDSASSWDFLRINVPQVLNLGLSGVPISGCDIGGFAEDTGSTPGPFFTNGKVTGAVTDDELFTRWMHLGAFLPWFRNHYNGYRKEFQEPWRYAEPVPTNCRKYVELRYRMLQLHYDAMYEWSQTGMPPARALFLNDPGDPEVYRHIDDQFFAGKDFLVAPILVPAKAGAGGAAVRSIYLPAGYDWYAFKDGSARLDPPVRGGTTIVEYRAGLDHVPIFVRAGAILPMHSLVEQYVGELAENPLEINFYPGPDDVYLLYQDDGITTQAEKDGTYRTTEIGHTTAPGWRSVRFSRIVDAYTPPERFHLARLLDTSRPSQVTVAGNVVPDAGALGGLLAAEGDAYYFDEQTGATIVKVFDDRADVTLAVFEGTGR